MGTSIDHTLGKLIQVESELLQIIRGIGHPRELGAYEAHAHVREAIKALSRKPSPKSQVGSL
jgi:hypothetical protein